jgi:8-oxo-dGTP diphosphatase
VGKIDDVVFHRYPEFDLYMLVYACSLDGDPRPVEVAELAWVEPCDLLKYDLLPADIPLCERLSRENGSAG